VRRFFVNATARGGEARPNQPAAVRLAGSALILIWRKVRFREQNKIDIATEKKRSLRNVSWRSVMDRRVFGGSHGIPKCCCSSGHAAPWGWPGRQPEGRQATITTDGDPIRFFSNKKTAGQQARFLTLPSVEPTAKRTGMACLP
jgi:hypothetical protein